MNRLLLLSAVLATLAAFLMVQCGKEKPVTPGFTITLTAPKTNFTGDGLVFYAAFSSAVTEGAIRWHRRGQIDSRTADPQGVAAVTGDTVRISWNDPAIDFTGISSRDTIYIEMEGMNDVSNAIIISLQNHAPTLDSAKMNNMTIEKTVGDSLGTLRMHLNPTVKGALRLYLGDADGQHPTFFVRGMPNTSPDSAYTDQWTYEGSAVETLLTGNVVFEDGRGGKGEFPLEVVVYNEAHSVWVASTNGPDTCRVSKLTENGLKLFSLDRFQQAKFIQVYPVNTNGTEAVWVVDRTRRAKSGAAAFTDTVFTLDDDGRVLHAVGGFKSNVTDLGLDYSTNTAYVIDSNTVKKITQKGFMTTHFTMAGGTLKGLSCRQNFPDEYWVGAQIPSAGRHQVFHVRGGAVTDTLAGDTLDAITTISTSQRNNIYWVTGDTVVVIADMEADTVISFIGGFYKPYAVANPKANSPVCWITDAGSSRLIKLTAGAGIPRRTTLSALSSAFATVSAVVVDQPRAIALDHTAGTTGVLWVADFNNYRILKVNAASGAALAVSIDYSELEIENPEAISVNVGVY